jgi:uncharacterized membrane protein
MQKTKSLFISIVFCIQVLLIFLLLFESRIELPAWLQVAGRLHPAIVHLPIGFLFFLVIVLLFRKQFKRKALDKFILVLLLFASLTASMAALFGFFLSQQGDYGPDALLLHKVSGVMLSIFCFGSVLALAGRERTRPLYVGLGVLSLGFVVLAGHTGANLTHGANYILAPLADTKSANPEDGTVYTLAVMPVLQKKCMNCHNETKAKGKLVMTSIAQFEKGGKNGKEWEEGKPESSRLIKLIRLPLGEEDHMPPDGKPQLTDLEIRLLENWIRSGADFEKRLSDLADTDSLKVISKIIAGGKVNEPTTREYSFEPASDETIRKLNKPSRAVFPLFRGSAALQADFFIKESFESKALEELNAVSEQLVVLNLSGMPVLDSDLPLIGKFKNLEKLNLNFSRLEGSTLSSLQELRHLSSLSLAGTRISADKLKALLNMPSLRTLFVWGTEVTEAQKIMLQGQHPGIDLITTQFHDESVLRLGKPLVVNDGIIQKGEKVELRHSMPGVTIRYTLDGSMPDSTTAKEYEKPLDLETTSKVRAIACKPGWYCSPILETTCFVDGIHPVRAELLSKTDKRYLGEGSKSLTDGRKGYADTFRDPAWLGFQVNPMVAGFDFGQSPPEIHSIVISAGINLGSHVFPPAQVEVWGGSNAEDARLIKSTKIVQPLKDEPYHTEAVAITLPASKYSYYKLIVRPVDKLPEWHGGKGRKGWAMVDEVFFY